MFQKKSLKLLLVSTLWMIALARVQAQQAMGLSDCILYALSNHPQVKLAELQITDAKWRIKENTATGLPQFTAGANLQRYLQRPALPAEALGFPAPPGTKISFALQNTINWNVQYSQLFFNSSYLLSLKAARYYREYVNLQMDATRQTLRNQVTEAYLPALLLTENLTILDKNISNLEKLLSDTKAIQKAGFAEQLDVDRLELALSNLRSERGNLARQEGIVVNALKFAMGMPVNQQISLSDNLNTLLQASGEADMSSQLNYMNRKEYVTLLKGRELSTVQIDIFKKGWMPTVAGFAQYQGAWQGNDKLFWIPAAIAGVSINVPIWDGGGTKAKKERAIIGAQQIEVQKQMLENAFELELSAARSQYANAQERVKNQQKNLELAQKIHDTTQTKYKAGVGSSFELVSAEQALFTAQQNLMQAQYDLLSAKNAVKKALGNE